MLGGHCRSAQRLPRRTRCGCRWCGAKSSAWRTAPARSSACSGLQDVAATAVADLPFGTQKRVELGARAGEPAQAAAAGRAGRRAEPRGGRRAAPAAAPHPRPSSSLTVLLVEHHMNLVMRVSDQVVALDFGRKIADGTPARGAEQPRRDAGLSGERRHERAAARGARTARAVRHHAGAARASTSRSPRAASPRSSAPTARARRRRCARSAAWCRRRARSCSPATRIDGARDRGHRAPGRRPRARRPRHLPQPDRRGEPAPGRLHPRATATEVQADFERMYGYFPAPEGAPRASRPARCRAASSRCWPCRAR